MHPPELKASRHLADVKYEIRGALARRADELERDGYDIVKLNIGNPGAFGFRMPDTMRVAMVQNLHQADPYSHQKGIFPAREAVVMQQQGRGVQGVSAEEVFIGNGVSELIDLTLRALLNDGDEVLVPSPDYPLWTAAVNLNRGRAVHYPCRPENGFVPDPDELAALPPCDDAVNSSPEEALFQFAPAKPAEKRATFVRRGSPHRLQRLPFGGFGIHQRSDALVQRGQHPAPADREPQQVGIRHLLMTHQPDAGKGDRFEDRKFIRPEGVILGDGIGGENPNRIAGLDGVPRKCRVGDDADETCLGHGARRPTLGAMTGKPLQCQIMPLVAGPKQGDEQVGVEQVTLHTPSTSMRRTSSRVTFGESAGRWNTTMPSLSWAGVEAFSPLRNRSDTVLPSETPRSLAWRAASSRTSSSNVSVVLTPK